MTKITDKIGGVNALAMWRSLGEPNGFGVAVFGQSKYGDELEVAGIYQRRHCKGRVEIVKEKFYYCENPQTENQQANRADFALAVSQWQGLDESTKMQYDRAARGKHLSGFNLYIKLFMLSR